MLKSLRIKNFILINDIKLNFNEGFSVFTGETGAGKSILIDAISILLGDRFSSDVVGNSGFKTIIEGEFKYSQPELSNYLKEQNIPQESSIILISRELEKEGKSSSRVNGSNVSIQMLKEIGKYLVDIHSQHDTQYLLNSRHHLDLLDKYINQQDLLSKVKDSYQQYFTLYKAYLEKSQVSLNVEDLDYLSFQVNEIEKAQLLDNEDIDLEKRIKELSSFEKTSGQLQTVLHALDEEEGVNEKLYDALRTMKTINDNEKIVQMTEEIDILYYELLDKISDIRQYKALLNYDENEMNSMQERLFMISRLKKKYGNSIQTILDKKKEYQDHIELIEKREEILQSIEIERDKAYQIYRLYANELSILRKQKAIELQSLIIKECSDLYLEKAQFKIDFTEGEDTSKGFDSVEFFISMNPGEILKPLYKVASGGELSRLMLGLKVIFNRLQGIETVIFDEIDSGVSGRIANAMGLKMSAISHSSQVFSVSHLGQVAACANYHYLVKKQQNGNSTITSIEYLERGDRIKELAFIASGSVSNLSLSAAEELLKVSQEAIQKV
ncbi:MAG: DNA repair protein RecN [Erysipelotrichaceae bacterium]